MFLRCQSFCLHRFVDQSAHSLRGAIIRSHFALIDKQCRSSFDSQRPGAGLIGLEALPDYVALYVLSKPIEIESDRFRVGIKQHSRVGSAAPNGLFPEQHVVHFPIAVLQTGRFGSQGGPASELMRRERKITKDQPHTWMILFYQLIEKRRELGTGRALEIAEFFQRNRSLWIAADVHRFRQTLPEIVSSAGMVSRCG
jgi:hypothetical protein